MLTLKDYQQEIEKICRQFPVRRLALFGSAVSKDFQDTSDVDVLVEFEEGKDIDYFGVYFKLKESLETLFERTVDLVVDRPFNNPVFQVSVDRSRKTIYERKSA